MMAANNNHLNQPCPTRSGFGGDSDFNQQNGETTMKTINVNLWDENIEITRNNERFYIVFAGGALSDGYLNCLKRMSCGEIRQAAFLVRSLQPQSILQVELKEAFAKLLEAAYAETRKAINEPKPIAVADCQHPDGRIYTWLVGNTNYQRGDFAVASHRNGALSYVKVLSVRELQDGEQLPACELKNNRTRKQRSKRERA